MSYLIQYKQHEVINCDTTFLRIVASFCGKSYSLQYLGCNSSIICKGKSKMDISEAIGTPTIFVNGYKYPKQYEYSDMEYYIDELKKLNMESKRQEAGANCN